MPDHYRRQRENERCSLCFRSHVVMLSFLDILYSFYSNFISFFRTNLLTQCPVPVVVFACFLLRRISLPKGVQMKRNFLEIFFWTRKQLGSQESTWGRPVGPTRHQGTTEAPGAPLWAVGPTGVSSTASQLYKYPNILETPGESMKNNSNCCKFQNHEINRDTIMEGFIILIGASPMLHEQFIVDLWVRRQQLDGFFSLSILNTMVSWRSI